MYWNNHTHSFTYYLWLVSHYHYNRNYGFTKSKMFYYRALYLKKFVEPSSKQIYEICIHWLFWCPSFNLIICHLGVSFVWFFFSQRMYFTVFISLSGKVWQDIRHCDFLPWRWSTVLFIFLKYSLKLCSGT